MRITLNLASRPFADLGPAIKRLRIAMGVLAVVALGLGLALRAFDQKAKVARARVQALDSQIARINQERQGYQNLMRRPDNTRLLNHIAMLNRLFDEKSFSWTLAMEDLETVLPGGVQVSTLEPARAKDGHITLHLRVIGPRDRAVELVRNLEHSRRFLLPRIMNENAESTGGPATRLEPVSASNRVDFDVLADYNPALPGERRAVRKPAPVSKDSRGLPASRGETHPLSAAPGPNSPPRTGQSRLPGPPPNPRLERNAPLQPKPNPAIYPTADPTHGGPQ